MPLTRKWFYTLIFTSNHFRVTQNIERARERTTQREREKECRESERKNNTERARTRTHPPTQPTSERKNQSSDPATESSDLANEWEKERELWSSHRHRSTSCRSRRAQLDNHRAKRCRPTVSESSNSHRSRPTHPIQLSQSITGPATPITEPNTDSRWVFRNWLTVHTLTSPVQPILPIRSLHYIYIYIFIYFFLFINFFNYPCFIKLCIYGLCIWNFGAFLVAGYSGLVFGLIFF